MADAETLDAAQDAQTQINPDVETRARSQGWRPKEEFNGSAARWKPADEFLRASETFMPVLQERNRALERRFDRVNSELADVKQVLSDFREFASKGEERAYNRARADLLAKRDVAVAHADTETFRAVDKEIADLDKSAAPAREIRRETPTQTQQKQQMHPDVEAWVSENRWFNTDQLLNTFAKALDADFEKSRPGLDVGDRLALVKAEVQKRFPDKFENPNREAATSVSAPSGGASRKVAKHSYENLPPEAKKQCDKYLKTIKGYTKEEYVRDYAWSDSE